MKLSLLAGLLGLFAVSSRGEILVTTATLGEEGIPTTGTGFTIVTYNSTVHSLRVQVEFSGLVGNTTASHIHAPGTAPGTFTVATQTPSFTGFPLGVTSGSYDHTFDLTLASSFRAGYITANGGVAGAEAALVNAIRTGNAYLNIHTTAAPGGEIRGFLQIDSDADGIPDSVDAFPHSRNVGGTVTIAGCDTEVDNLLFEDGSTLTDLIDQVAAGAKNHGKFVSGVAKLKNSWRKAGILTAEESEAIQECAAEASLP